MTMNILLAEDDRRLQVIITDYFAAKGHTVDCADDGSQAIERFAAGDYQAVLLDVMMPQLDGFAAGRAIRGLSNVPIVYLTARVQEEDMLRGYGLGADDYITKPFSLPVLVAKIEALVRRAGGQASGGTLTVGRIRLELPSRRAFVDDDPLTLSPKVYELLRVLMREQGRILSREQLLVAIWGYDYPGSDRVVDSHIKKLRKALGPCAGYIRTVTGVGYGLEADHE